MKDTNELCEWLDIESKLANDDDCPVAAMYLKDAANHIRAQDARIAELTAQRKPLSDAEIDFCFVSNGWSASDMYYPVVRDIEAVHGIKGDA